MLKRSALACAAFVCGLAVLPLAAQSLAMGRSASSPATDGRSVATAQLAIQQPIRIVMPAVPVGRIVVQNRRRATLLDLSITPLKKTGGRAKPRVIAHDLATDQKAVASLPKEQGCHFAIRGHFDDATKVTIARRNLCRDGAITLAD
ncbi:MAG: hypothetical protein B7Z80_26410 [Rhodospirillales bacterium 20-64-7]|nr:MAG: hypothetical protein B7Z80_26410 [Rhodospirillales bacterium 20-64-7]